MHAPRIRAAILALAVAGAVAACQPGQAPYAHRPPVALEPVPVGEWPAPTTTTTTAPPANTDEQVVFGDSLGDQINATPITQDGRTWRTRSGADLAWWQAEVDAAIARRPAVITLALSSNDAGPWKPDGGWTADDDARWRDTLDRAHAAGIRVAVVLPWFTPDVDAAYPTARAEVDKARAALAAMPFDAVVDWSGPSAGHIAADGIHLLAWGPTVTPAVEARYSVVDQAADAAAR